MHYLGDESSKKHLKGKEKRLEVHYLRDKSSKAHSRRDMI
jgi:hypothetical protein